MAVIAAFMQGGIYNFGLATIFALLLQGAITGWSDRLVFPRLHHQALAVGN